jgi:PDZ domain
VLACALLLAEWSPAPLLADEPASVAIPAAVQQAVADLSASEFTHRQAAEQRLIALGPSAFEPLLGLLSKSAPESGQRILAILEQIWLRTPEPQSDILERQLEALRLTYGPYQPTVEHLLFAHHRLREERAVRALRRLNAVIETEDDPDEIDLLMLQGLPIPKAPPQHLTQIVLPRSWKGTEADLWHIQRLSHLKSLTVFVIENNGITPSAWQRMQIGFPNLTVNVRAEVFLGVVGSQFDEGNGCYVSLVQAGSPAETAGIQPGDRILSVDGTKISKFEDLIKALKTKRAYQAMELQVVQGYERRFPSHRFEQQGQPGLTTLTVIGIPWEAKSFKIPPPPQPSERLPVLPISEIRLSPSDNSGR